MWLLSSPQAAPLNRIFSNLFPSTRSPSASLLAKIFFASLWLMVYIPSAFIGPLILSLRLPLHIFYSFVHPFQASYINSFFCLAILFVSSLAFFFFSVWTYYIGAALFQKEQGPCVCGCLYLNFLLSLSPPPLASLSPPFPLSFQSFLFLLIVVIYKITFWSTVNMLYLSATAIIKCASYLWTLYTKGSTLSPFFFLCLVLQSSILLTFSSLLNLFFGTALFCSFAPPFLFIQFPPPPSPLPHPFFLFILS